MFIRSSDKISHSFSTLSDIHNSSLNELNEDPYDLVLLDIDISSSLKYPNSSPSLLCLLGLPCYTCPMAEVISEDNVITPYDRNHADAQHEDDQASLSSDATQTGVKNIEVVSQTWTQASLIASYLG